MPRNRRRHRSRTHSRSRSQSAGSQQYEHKRRRIDYESPQSKGTYRCVLSEKFQSTLTHKFSHKSIIIIDDKL